MRSLVLVVVLVIAGEIGGGALPAGPFSQTGPRTTPARDPVQPQTGTAQLSGRVTAADNGTPLRQVEITLSSSALRGPRTARTNAAGEYRFGNLAAGRYWIRASRPGFVGLRYGAADPLESGRYVDVAAGGAAGVVNLSLPRAAVISGQVLDEFGEPVLDVEVRAMRYQTQGGQRRLTTASRVRLTDDLGAYRLFGLLPGTYYVSAVARGRDPIADEVEQPEGRPAPTYYPGAVDLAQALPVTVPVGGEVSGINFSLAVVRTARIRGIVLDSTGRPAIGAQMTAVRRESGNTFVTAAETRARGDGTFELANLPPGSYSVQAWLRGTADAAPEFGAALVQAAGTDIDGVGVRTDAGGTVRGRVVLRGDTGQAPFRPSLVEITARPASQEVRLPVGAAATARVRADWTFELRGLSGERVLRVSGVPAPWALEAITFDGDDVTDAAIQLKPGVVATGLELVLTTRATEIAGLVEQAQSPGGPLSVVVFPVDRSHWEPTDRRVQIRRVSAAGGFQIRGLPPGDYLAVAVPFVWQGEWSDPDFLQRASLSATRVSLAPAERKTVRLKVTPISQ